MEQILSQNNKHTSLSLIFLDTYFPSNLCDFLYFSFLLKSLHSFFLIFFRCLENSVKLSAQNSQWTIPNNFYKFVCSSCQHQRFQPRNQKAWIITICICLCSIVLNNTVQESLRLISIHKSSHNSTPQLNFLIGII